MIVPPAPALSGPEAGACPADGHQPAGWSGPRNRAAGPGRGRAGNGPVTIYREKILFVDEDELFCEGLLRHFNSQKSFQIAAVAADWVEAREKTQQYKPDIIILNINLIHSDWLEAIRFFRREFPYITIIVLANQEKNYPQAVEAGGNALLPKTLSFNEILQIVGSVHENSALVIYRDSDPGRGRATTPAPAREEPLLTQREREIITLVSQGCQNKEIADRLSIKIATVNNHLYNIFKKLGCSNRTEAVFELSQRKMIG